jgi:hypothetical protein
MESKMNGFHVQCKLRCKDSYTTSWIPEKFAKKGNVVSLMNDNYEWEDGWVVIEVGSKLMTSYVMERERDFKRTRKASDI